MRKIRNKFISKSVTNPNSSIRTGAFCKSPQVTIPLILLLSNTNNLGFSRSSGSNSIKGVAAAINCEG